MSSPRKNAELATDTLKNSILSKNNHKDHKETQDSKHNLNSTITHWIAYYRKNYYYNETSHKFFHQCIE